MIGFKVMFTGLLFALLSMIGVMFFNSEPKQKKLTRVFAAIFLAGFTSAFIGAIWQIWS